jgi:Arc/MetJ family transcription regulator
MHDAHVMRTTLDLDDDLLQAAKEIAERRGVSAGRAVSDLIRKALQPMPGAARFRNGVPLLSRDAGSPVMTMARVNQLRDE